MQGLAESVTPGALAADKARHDFIRMSVSFSITHGSATTVLAYATTLLDEKAGLIGNSLLYLATLVAALFLAAPGVKEFGCRGGLLLGLGLYCVYVSIFTVSLFFSSAGVQIILFSLASVVGGLGAGVLWTAQGGYMTYTSDYITSVTGEPRTNVTTMLASRWGIVYLLGEMVAKLGYSALQYCGLSSKVACLLYIIVSILATTMLLTVPEVDRPGQHEKKSDPLAKLLEAVKLWPDPKLWLLAPGNITFGFSSAFMNGIFLSRFLVPLLGEESVGLFSSSTVAFAALASPVWGFLATMWGRGLVVFIGAASFLSIPLLVVLLQPQDWRSGFAMLIFFVLQGAGRAVYETTNRAIFSDFFSGVPESAFANVLIQGSISPAICFFLSSYLQQETILTMIGASAVLTMIGYPIASLMHGGDETVPLLGPEKRQATS